MSISEIAKMNRPLTKQMTQKWQTDDRTEHAQASRAGGLGHKLRATARHVGLGLALSGGTHLGGLFRDLLLFLFFFWGGGGGGGGGWGWQGDS